MLSHREVPLNTQQIVNGWLAKINPPDRRIALNEYGQCPLICQEQENCVVYVPSSSSTEFILFQDVTVLPAPCDAAILEEILKMNLPSVAKRDGTLALDPETRNIIFLITREIARTDIGTFCAILDKFMNAGKEVRKRLQHLLPGSTPEKPPLERSRFSRLQKFDLFPKNVVTPQQ
jgi:hypothetical protein